MSKKPIEYEVPARFLMRRVEGGPQGHSRVMLLGVAIDAPAELPASRLMMAQGTMKLSIDGALLAPEGVGAGKNALQLITSFMGYDFEALEQNGWTEMKSCTPEPPEPDEDEEPSDAKASDGCPKTAEKNQYRTSSGSLP